MKRSQPSRALRAGPDFGFRGDGAESPPLAKGKVDDYGETVIRPTASRQPPVVQTAESDQPADLDGFARAVVRAIMEIECVPAPVSLPEDAA